MLVQKLKEQQEDDQNDDMIEEMERESGVFAALEYRGLITMEKLTEFRYFYEQHQELIPANESQNYAEDAEYRVDLDKLKTEMEKIFETLQQLVS